MSQSANAVLARVRSMYGKRLTANDYSNLLSCTGNAEIANYLKTRTSYADIFSPTAGLETTTESVEFALKKEYAQRLQKICSFERMIHDPFYDYFVLKSDIELIMDAARTLVSTASLARVYVPNDFFRNRSAIDSQKLYNAKTASELIEALSHTRYYATAKKFIGVDGMFHFSDVEMHLMRFYANTAKRLGKKLPKDGARELEQIIDLEIDSFNIASIYRLKKLGTKKEWILARLIFDHGTISKSKLLGLLEADSDHTFVELLSKTKLGYHITLSDLVYPESVFEKNIYRTHKRLLRFSSNPDIVFISYMNLLNTEMANITHIVEGKRYKMTNEQILPFLVGTE